MEPLRIDMKRTEKELEKDFFYQFIHERNQRTFKEFGGNMRCMTSDGRNVNMAEELNKLEEICMKDWEKAKIDVKFQLSQMPP